MIYRAIGVISGSSQDGMTIAFAEFRENAGQWSYVPGASVNYSYTEAWIKLLETAADLTAAHYQFLDMDFGFYTGRQVNKFIEENNLQYQVALVTSSGYTALFQPGRMISQLGSGAAIAAETKLPVVTNLPFLDVALGGNGKFIHAIAEKIGMDISPAGDEKQNNLNRAVCVALAGVLRWREEYNMLSSVTGASRSSIGGAVWLGQEA